METDIRICLTQAQEAHDFVAAAERFESDIDVICGRYIVNAKSMLGVLSLISEGTLTVCIRSEDADEIEAFTEAMKRFAAS